MLVVFLHSHCNADIIAQKPMRTNSLISGKKKAHKHKLFCPVGLGTTPGLLSGLQKGPAERGHIKKPQKSSKSVKFSTLFDNFRAGQKTSKIVKKCQKVFRHFSTIFARHLFSGPFCNPLICPGDFTGFVPGTNPVKIWDKPGFSPYFTQWKPDFTGFVPGTNPVCPWDNPGDEGRHRKFM